MKKKIFHNDKKLSCDERHKKKHNNDVIVENEGIRKVITIVVFIIEMIALLVGIACFSSELIGIGILSLFIGVITLVLYYLYPKLNMQITTMAIISVVMAIIMGVISMCAGIKIENYLKSLEPPFEGILTTENFTDAFSLSTSLSSTGFEYTILARHVYSDGINSSEKINVAIGYTFHGGSGDGKTGSVDIVLKKNCNYYVNGSLGILGTFTYKSCSFKITHVDGCVFLS